MIYAHGLGLAALSSVIIQSQAKDIVANQEAELLLIRPHEDAERNLGSVNFQDNTGNSNIPSETCMTEAACKEQAKRLGFQDIHYYVSD